jgi:hypothetical protein
MACLLGTLALPQASYCSTETRLTSSVETSTDGKFVLSWQLTDSAYVELQQQVVNLDDYRTIYTGSDTASVITGLADGDYSYRIRTVTAKGDYSNWTAPVSVAVRHHPLPRAFGFFAVGAIVFISTIVLIVLGTRGRLGSEQKRES